MHLFCSPYSVLEFHLNIYTNTVYLLNQSLDFLRNTFLLLTLLAFHLNIQTQCIFDFTQKINSLDTTPKVIALCLDRIVQVLHCQ